MPNGWQHKEAGVPDDDSTHEEPDITEESEPSSPQEDHPDDVTQEPEPADGEDD